MFLVERSVAHLSQNTTIHIALFQEKSLEMQNAIIIIAC
jgi:hypothetical protein